MTYDPRKITERVWQLMKEAYGSSWSNKYGDEPTAIWIETLAEYDAKLIGQAVKQCAKQKAHSPTLAEFVQFIKSQHMTTAEYLETVEHRKPLTEQERKAAQQAIKNASPKKQTKSKRSILLPDESYSDFQVAMFEAKSKGITEAEFRRERLLANGWTDSDEQTFLVNLQKIGKYAQLGPRCS